MTPQVAVWLQTLKALCHAHGVHLCTAGIEDESVVEIVNFQQVQVTLSRYRSPYATMEQLEREGKIVTRD